MKPRFWVPLLVLTMCGLAYGQDQWTITASTLTYHVKHKLHRVDGTSHQARGKGVCGNGRCEFLIAVPVSSFDSGDSNRDLHMQQTTRAAQHPMVTVRTTLPAEPSSATLALDLDIGFAGQTHRYTQVPFRRDGAGAQARITGRIPLKTSDFQIERPSLLTIPIQDETPVDIDLTWTQKTP